MEPSSCKPDHTNLLELFSTVQEPCISELLMFYLGRYLCILIFYLTCLVLFVNGHDISFDPLDLICMSKRTLLRRETICDRLITSFIVSFLKSSNILI